MKSFKRTATLLSIILFLLIGALLVVGMRDNNASEREITCVIERLKYDLWLRSTPPECLLGANMSFNVCEGEAYPESDINNLSKEEVIRRFWLPLIYENLRDNCLSSIRIDIPGNINEEDLRLYMLELITTESIEVVCTLDTTICYEFTDTNGRLFTTKGRVLERDLNAGIDRIYLCDEYIDYELAATTFVHEVSHIAISRLAGVRVGLQEAYPNNVGMRCSRR